MLTIKVREQKEYLLPRNCVFCYSEHQINGNRIRSNHTESKVNRNQLVYGNHFFKCQRCRKLYNWAKILSNVIPLIVLLLALHFEFVLYGEEVIPNRAWNATVMITIILAAIVCSAIFEYSANNYLLKNGIDSKNFSVNNRPVRKNRETKEKGYLVLDFINDDYALSFVKLNNGNVLYKNQYNINTYEETQIRRTRCVPIGFFPS